MVPESPWTHFMHMRVKCENTKYDTEIQVVSLIYLTLFRMGGEVKKVPYQFFLCNFYKRRNYPTQLYDF